MNSMLVWLQAVCSLYIRCIGSPLVDRVQIAVVHDTFQSFVLLPNVDKITVYSNRRESNENEWKVATRVLCINGTDFWVKGRANTFRGACEDSASLALRVASRE